MHPQHSTHRSPRPLVERVCEHCAAPFFVRPSRLEGGAGRFCGLTCRRAHTPPQERVCSVCGVAFTIPAHRRGPRAGLFCSRVCKDARFQQDIAERFWAKVDRRGGPAACWPWVARAHHRGGYGRVTIAQKAYDAHVAAWVLTHGAVPPGLKVRHVVCGNQPCCNPAHLALGTQLENMADARRQGRRLGRPRRAAP